MHSFRDFIKGLFNLFLFYMTLILVASTGIYILYLFVAKEERMVLDKAFAEWKICEETNPPYKIWNGGRSYGDIVNMNGNWVYINSPNRALEKCQDRIKWSGTWADYSRPNRDVKHKDINLKHYKIHDLSYEDALEVTGMISIIAGVGTIGGALVKNVGKAVFKSAASFIRVGFKTAGRRLSTPLMRVPHLNWK